MSEDFIDYSALVEDAMHIIVKKSLEILAKKEFQGDHHFFISFVTRHPDVNLSEKLRGKYPDEMTIVLQYQFEDLKISDHGFSVVLSFDNVKEKVAVPFEALTAFADPSVKFGLQFRHYEEDLDIEEEEELVESDNDSGDSKLGKIRGAKPKKSAAKSSSKSKTGSKQDNNVVNLDTFRKKK